MKRWRFFLSVVTKAVYVCTGVKDETTCSMELTRWIDVGAEFEPAGLQTAHSFSQ